MNDTLSQIRDIKVGNIFHVYLESFTEEEIYLKINEYKCLRLEEFKHNGGWHISHRTIDAVSIPLPDCKMEIVDHGPMSDDIRAMVNEAMDNDEISVVF